MTATLRSLANLGPQSEAMLHAAGVADVQTLRKLGAVRAYLRVRQRDKAASLNLLWALEGALTGQRWQDVARHERSRLLIELEAAREAAGLLD